MAFYIIQRVIDTLPKKRPHVIHNLSIEDFILLFVDFLNFGNHTLYTANYIRQVLFDLVYCGNGNLFEGLIAA